VAALPNVAVSLPDPWMLIVQSRMRVSPSDLTVAASDRMSVNTEPLTVADYHRFVRLSDIGLAWYDPSDPNLRYVGLSSGKIAQYWALGKPVIVNRLPLYEDILPKYACGRIVDRPEEIPAAVAEIGRELERYQRGAREAYEALFNVDRHALQISKALASVAAAEVPA
jgi:glycosyltransferase involved in cell wall biosynthesis